MIPNLWETIIDKFPGTPAAATLDGRSPRLWDKAYSVLYRYLNAKLEHTTEISFLNYGYAPPGDERISLRPRDEANRVYIQLYHRVVGPLDLGGLDVLEISCGRGGGAEYVHRYHRPRLMCGVDRAQKAVAFCQRHHAGDSLFFAGGDAQVMPIAAGSFDAVINIEASHDYPDLPAFLAEVKRVLRPGGHFMYADFRKRQHCGPWHEQIMRSGMNIVEKEDITRDVVRGLELNSEHSALLVDKLAPAPLRPLFRQFAGVKGSCVYRMFDSGKAAYLRYLIRKEM